MDGWIARLECERFLQDQRSGIPVAVVHVQLSEEHLGHDEIGLKLQRALKL